MDAQMSSLPETEKTEKSKHMVAKIKKKMMKVYCDMN